ncbi:alginate lyase family protein [Niabella drilacis]|uniref:Alginate lyase n=1 Tax=Niabella drilacis (strain DSM 25811 / CCM 8410 / CCUG 62505 / LMG 26954 / E90) TaxID=1285928 RepID=A0A1G6S5N9_NIADE|nr:alginate lyase family protein [Niabella drilacis]SDD12178.1 Alginate lyase [Niabella drilacis]
MKRNKILVPVMILAIAIGAAVTACSKPGLRHLGTWTPVADSSARLVIDTLAPTVALKHGGLHTSGDFARVKAKIAAKAEPWYSGWNRLIANSHAQVSYVANPTVKLIRGGGSREEPEADNYSRAMNDAAAAYQLALRWKISGDDTYAATAIAILNAWAVTCKSINGDSNSALAAGFYGYQFALAGELLRDYNGWAAADFTAYKKWMTDVFYSLNYNFLSTHFGSCVTNAYANWDLANLASVLSIAILTDNRSMYNYAVSYLQTGRGNGNWYLAINNVFEGADAGLAQLQESGRDQGHATLCISLMGVIAQLTWNQGDDFFGLDDNRFLKACEYTAKYNVASLNVPYRSYTRIYGANCGSTEVHSVISDNGRGTVRPMWSLPYFHYVKIKKLTAKYSEMGVQSTLPEGGGGDYGPNSGGFDQLGFGTLMFTLD